MGLRCKACGGEEHVKNGFMRGKQRYRCKACGLNFTDTPPPGKPLAMKVTAVLLYVSGLSMNRTAKLLGVSTPTVQAWIEQFAKAYAQKPAPEGRVNRPGFAGGWLAWVTPPGRAPQGWRSSALPLRRAGGCRSARAAGGG
jgi:transposase-like protein